MKLAVVIAVAALALGGCKRQIDKDKCEKAIANALVDRGFDATVTCPSGEAVKKGATFNCDAVAKDGTKLAIEVIQDDDEGNVTFRTKDGSLVDTSKIVKEAQAKLGPTAKIACPKRAVLLAKKGDTTDCTIDTNGAKSTLVITLDNETSGDLKWAVQ